MSLFIRRCLYIFFIIIFLIVAPLIILYASGYKLRSGFAIQKTGALIIATKPKGASIYLNNKLQQDFLKNIFSRTKTFTVTPAKIKNLLPEEYTVKLALNGYWPWEKKVSVLPGQSTYIEAVNLFKNDLPLLITSG